MDGTAPTPAGGRPELTRLKGCLRAIGERTGKKSQKEQAEVLGLRPNTWSDLINGKRVPERKNVESIVVRSLGHTPPLLTAQECEEFLTMVERARAERDSRPMPGDGTPPANLDRERATRRRGGAWLLGVAASVVLLAGGWVAVTVLHDDTPEPVGAAVCDRYRVTAETLSIRRSDGSQTGSYFTKGEAVAVERRSGGTGNKYWYVSGDGRTGWVLPSPRYWQPLC